MINRDNKYWNLSNIEQVHYNKQPRRISEETEKCVEHVTEVSIRAKEALLPEGSSVNMNESRSGRRGLVFSSRLRKINNGVRISAQFRPDSNMFLALLVNREHLQRAFLR